MKNLNKLCSKLLTTAFLPVMGIDSFVAEQVGKKSALLPPAGLPHSLHMTSLHNARDLGGYTTADGKTVRTGRILRTGKLEDASTEDLRRLTEEFHLKAVFDLRSGFESRQAADPALPGVQEYILGMMPYGSFTYPLSVKGFRTFFKDIQKGIYITFMQNIYKDLILTERGQQDLSDCFHKMLPYIQNEQPILIHCTAGKDRTGIVSAILLSLLGVDNETIVQDYLLTNDYQKPYIQLITDFINSRLHSAWIARDFSFYFGVTGEHIRLALSNMEEGFGTAEEFCIAALHLTKQDVQDIKNTLLI